MLVIDHDVCLLNAVKTQTLLCVESVSDELILFIL